MRFRHTKFPSVYFQVWDADTLIVDGLVSNLGEAQSEFLNYQKEYPNSNLKAYHLVRANVR